LAALICGIRALLSVPVDSARFSAAARNRFLLQDPTAYLELAAAAQQDPEPYVSGSFDDVAAAHQEGKITDDEYAVLSEAVADSKRAQDRRRAEESSGSG
jgi:hypothetical protein